MRKMERYSHDVQTTVTLVRCLVVRVLAIAFAAYRYYTEEYCPKAPATCRVCLPPDDVGGEVNTKGWWILGLNSLIIIDKRLNLTFIYSYRSVLGISFWHPYLLVSLTLLHRSIGSRRAAMRIINYWGILLCFCPGSSSWISWWRPLVSVISKTRERRWLVGSWIGLRVGF